MNYTENYRLNQWDPEDRLLREDFNRDNANVESGMMSLKQDLQTEAQNREAAVTAAKQEASAQVAAAKQEASQALTAATGTLESSKADKTALAQLQAVVDAMPFVKLREITVGSAVNQVDVDVSDIQWEKYAYVMLVPKLLVAEKINIAVRMNGIDSLAYYGDNSGMYCLYELEGCIVSAESSISAQIRISEANGYITTILNSCNQKGYLKAVGGSPRPSFITASNLETINFVAYDDVLIQAGGKIFIYGVRL